MDAVLLANSEGAVGMEAAWKILLGGGTALDAAEAGVRATEADPRVRSVGRGGAPNLLGEVECDAAVMDGRTRETGAVGALQGYLYAVSVARGVMERLPHVFLVAEGAARFAAEIGAERAEMLTAEARREHERWIAEHVGPGREALRDGPLAEYAWESARGLLPHGTVVYLVRDARGDIAVATSTSGWARKYPGRLGDTGVVGAGLYADNRYGACATTHTGEAIIRAGLSRAVILHMAQGCTAEEACREALRDLHQLSGGLRGPVIVHVLDRDGRAVVMSSGEIGAEIGYCLQRAGMETYERARPLPFIE